MDEQKRKDLFENAVSIHRQYGGCGQCLLKALHDDGYAVPEAVVKAATGMAAGVARGGNACGAYTGGVLAISSYYGRDIDDMENLDRVSLCMEKCRAYRQRFMEEYGSVDCRDVQYHIMGASYRMYDEADRAKFLEGGGHDDKCPYVVGKAAVWVAEIIGDEK